MAKTKRETTATRHAFLLTFFDSPNRYSHVEINGFILVRQFNRNSNRWEVAIYTLNSWNKSQTYLKRYGPS